MKLSKKKENKLLQAVSGPVMDLRIKIAKRDTPVGPKELDQLLYDLASEVSQAALDIFTYKNHPSHGK